MFGRFKIERPDTVTVSGLLIFRDFIPSETIGFGFLRLPLNIRRRARCG